MTRQEMRELLAKWLVERELVGSTDWLTDFIGVFTGIRPLRPDDLEDLLDRMGLRDDPAPNYSQWRRAW